MFLVVDLSEAIVARKTEPRTTIARFSLESPSRPGARVGERVSCRTEAKPSLLQNPPVAVVGNTRGKRPVGLVWA